MKVELNMKEHGIQCGHEPRRLITLDEFLEHQCVICYEKESVFFVTHTNFRKEEEDLYLCPECSQTLLDNIIDAGFNKIEVMTL